MLGLDLNWLYFGDSISEGNIANYNNSKKYEIPILDIYVAAGINGYCNNDYAEDEGSILIPKHMLKQDKKYYCIKVKGKSMEPTLAEGSYIIVSEIQEKSCLQDEDIYIIITNEGIAYLKRIKLDIENNRIQCISDNFDKFAFPDIYLSTDEIHKIFEINIYITNTINNSAHEVLKRLILLESDIVTIKSKLNK